MCMDMFARVSINEMRENERGNEAAIRTSRERQNERERKRERERERERELQSLIYRSNKPCGQPTHAMNHMSCTAGKNKGSTRGGGVKK